MMNLNYLVCLRIVAVGLFLIGFTAGCSLGQKFQSQQKPQPPANVQPILKQVEEAQAKQREIQAQYKAMQVPELAQRLEADSVKDVEPFNSLAYREVISRGPTVARELASFVKTPDRSSFLTLIAVRKVDKGVYESIETRARAQILTDALRTSKYFNSWGLPHLYWEDAAKAIIELRDAAVEPLKPLLQDKRDAPVWGSEEVMEYQKYKYRVCDYAWAMLMEIEGKKVEIPADPAARDRLIAEMSK